MNRQEVVAGIQESKLFGNDVWPAIEMVLPFYTRENFS